LEKTLAKGLLITEEKPVTAGTPGSWYARQQQVRKQQQGRQKRWKHL